GGDLAEPGSVRIDDGDLRAAVDSICRDQEQVVEAVEERTELADAEDNAVAPRRPLGPKHAATVLMEDNGRLVAAGLHDEQVVAARRRHVRGHRVSIARRME